MISAIHKSTWVVKDRKTGKQKWVIMENTLKHGDHDYCLTCRQSLEKDGFEVSYNFNIKRYKVRNHG